MSTVLAPAERLRRGIACGGCNRRLPLRASHENECSALWECAGCRQQFAGVVVTDAPSLVLRQVRLADFHFEDDAAPISQALRRFVRGFDAGKLAASHKRPDLRRSIRIARELEVTVVGVDAHCTSAGQPVHGIVANLSAQGMLLVAEMPTECETVVTRVMMGHVWVQLLGQIAWSRELEDGFFVAGIEFLGRLADLAQS